VPTAVFSEPEVGAIGMTEAEACARLAQVDIYKTTFRPMKMSLAGRDTRAFFKLVVDGETDRVVGCHVVGPDAAEMIQLVGVAVKMNATKADFDAVMAVHPTAAEELVTLRTKALTHRREAAE
jgi:glutathione reductase (NADPH)